MNRRRIWAIAHKEVLHILRDPRTLAILVVVPLLLLVLFGYAIDLDVDEVRLVVTDYDRSPESRSVVSVLERTGYFTVTAEIDEHRTADEALHRKRADAIIQFDPGFAAAVLRGEQAPVQVVLDGADPLAGAASLGLIEASLQAAAEQLAETPTRPPLQLVARALYNPQLDSSLFLVPGLMAMILVITAVVSIALAVVREKETGTIEQIAVSPLAAGELIIGKCLPYAGVSLAVAGLILALGYLLFGIGIAGSPVALAAATLAFLFACLGLGLLVSTIARTQQVAFMLAVLTTYLPSFLLSGFVFPIRNMPVPIQIVTHLVPARYYLEAVRRVMIKGTGFEAVAIQVAVLVLFAAVTIGTAALRLRYRWRAQ